MSDAPASFAVLLRRHRKAAGLTQEELAERAGISWRSISDLERGVNHPRRDTMLLLAGPLALDEDEKAAFARAARRPAPPPAASLESPPLADPERAGTHSHAGVYLAHAQDDQGTVQRLRTDLRRHGLTVWVDAHDLPPGTQSWEQALREAIRAAVAFVLVASPHTRSSRYVADELRIAELYGRRVYPLWVAGTEWMECVPLGWGGLQYLDGREGRYEVALAALAAEVTHLQGPAPARATGAPPSKSLRAGAQNLPVQQTSFLGRERELAEVSVLLRQPEVHLLTLTGTGGTGKTRLALQAAVELVDDNWDGAHFVDLSPLSEAELVLSSIAKTLGVRESGGTPLEEIVTGYLKDKELLLVLDNFEQVLGAAGLVGRLLGACPRLTVLVTSRIVLRAYGEHEYPVPPLALPSRSGLRTLEQLSQYAAVALFIERAEAVRPDFQVTDATAPAVAEICRRLDGLPLAIELAAARVRLLPPPALLARLENRLGTLTGGARTLPARQQTLRATIEWSYHLLTPAEQAFFTRMSVFVGGRTLEAIEAVCLDSDDPTDALACYDVLDGVSSLLEKSLLRREEGTGEEDEPRFVLLETLQEYAREALEKRGETGRFRARHVAYFLVLAEEAAPGLTGQDQGAWLARLEAEHDNLRAALRWAGERAERYEAGLRLANALWRFWYRRGHFSEGRRWLEEVATPAPAWSAAPSDPPPSVGSQGHSGPKGLGGAEQAPAAVVAARATALSGAGSFAWYQGDYTRATALQEESLALSRELGDTQGIADSLNSLGLVTYEQGDYARTTPLFEQSLALRRELGDTRGIASSLDNLGNIAYHDGDYARARMLYEESLALWRKLGDKGGIANVLSDLGLVAEEQDDYALATVLHEQSLALSRELGDKRGIATSLHNLGDVAQELGDYALVTFLHEESLVLFRDLGDKRNIAYSIEGLAGAASAPNAAPGMHRRAARLLGAAAALRAALGAPLPSSEQGCVERTEVALRAALGEEAYTAAWAEGQALTLEQAVALALERELSRY